MGCEKKCGTEWYGVFIAYMLLKCAWHWIGDACFVERPLRGCFIG